MRLVRALAAAIAAAFVITAPAHAQTKIIVGYTAAIDVTPLFVALDKGYFQKRGIEVVPQFMAVNPLIPPALVSDSIQIGMPTTTTFLQAVDGGIDLVAVAGLNFTRKADVNFGVVTRTGTNISKPQDFVGKKVGVPGLGAFLHVMFREWLKANGVDPKQVQFVETPFPQMNEIMKAGSIDAAVSAEPFQSRIIKSGTGAMMAYFTRELPEDLPIVFFAATRKWTSANAAAAKGFRDGLAEGMTQTHANLPEAHATASKYLKLPLEIVSSVQLPPFKTEVKPEALARWISIMKGQDMLTNPVSADKLVFN